MEEQLITKKIISYDDKTTLYLISFIEFICIMCNIKTPDVQVDLSQSKVNNMTVSYNKYPHHFGSRSLITIAHVKMNHTDEYFLVDGQHRVAMIKELLKTDNNSNIIVALVTVKSDKEFKQLFDDINADSLKYNIKDYSVFNKKLYELLKKKYSNYSYLPKINSGENTLYTLSGFIDVIIGKKIMEHIKNNSVLTDAQKNDDKFMAEFIFDYINTKQTEYFKKCKYTDNYIKNKNIYTEDEIISIENCSCMFMIYNNFVDCLFDETIEPIHYFSTSFSITDMIRANIWKKVFGRKRVPQKCPCLLCPNTIIKDNAATWNCSYIKHIMNGGLPEIANMTVSCIRCYNNMNKDKLDMKDWEDTLISHHINDAYFSEDDAAVKCGITKCNTIINKDTFIAGKIISSKTNEISYKPICGKH